MNAITSRTAADLRRRKTAAAAAPDHSTPRGHTAARPRRSIAEWWHFAVEHLLMLPAGAAIALVWVNTPVRWGFPSRMSRWCCSSA